MTRRQVDEEIAILRKAAKIVDLKVQKQGKPLLRGPKRGQKNESPRGRRNLLYRPRKNRRRRKRIRCRERPCLSKGVEGHRPRRIPPSEETMSLGRRLSHEEIDPRETPKVRQALEYIRMKMPVRE